MLSNSGQGARMLANMLLQWPRTTDAFGFGLRLAFMRGAGH